MKRIVKSFDEKKKKAQQDMANEQSATAKLELQQHIGDYDLIIGAANDAISRINKKPDTKKDEE